MENKIINLNKTKEGFNSAWKEFMDYNKENSINVKMPIQFLTTQRQGCVASRDCFTCGKKIDGSCVCIVETCPHCGGKAMDLDFDAIRGPRVEVFNNWRVFVEEFEDYQI